MGHDLNQYHPASRFVAASHDHGCKFGGHAPPAIRLGGHDLQGIWPPKFVESCPESAPSRLKNLPFIDVRRQDVSPSDEIWPKICRLWADGF